VWGKRRETSERDNFREKELGEAIPPSCSSAAGNRWGVVVGIWCGGGFSPVFDQTRATKTFGPKRIGKRQSKGKASNSKLAAKSNCFIESRNYQVGERAVVTMIRAIWVGMQRDVEDNRSSRTSH